MSRTRSRAKKPKPATAPATGATSGTLRRSRRLLQSNSNGSDHSSVDPPGVRENAQNTLGSSKTSTGAATTTPIALPPRRSQRLLLSNVKSSYRCPSGTHANAQNTPETTTTTTVLRRSKRLLQSKTGSLNSCCSGTHENAQNTPETTITTTVLRRSKRLLQSKNGSLKSGCSDGNMQQGHGLLKKLSSQRSGKSTCVKIGAVRLNFDGVANVKCNDPIGNIGGSSERRIVCCLPAFIPAHSGRRKSELRIRDTDVGVGQGKDSTKLTPLAVNIGKIIQKDDDANKKYIDELEATSCESDSPFVSKLKKRCFRKTSKKGVGVKRNKKQNDDVIQGADSGWTKEQEKALQGAYMAAKPTPNFWKSVARFVPGKSSQECFDKVNSENLTPRVPPPRSRCKQKTLSPPLEISFSDPELLPEPNRKRKSRRKSHINQKMVRNLMRKNSHLEPDKADFFCVLEPTVNPLLPLSPVLSTPTTSAEKGAYSSSRSRSLSNQKKCKSRFSGKSVIPIASPPVLKPVRNMALHDKYVDQLHAREAKRKTRSTLLKGNVNEPLLKSKDVVQAAKESLISDARDVITKFRHSEMYIESCNNSEEGIDDLEEDEDDEDAL